jgi:hypothetical protein
MNKIYIIAKVFSIEEIIMINTHTDEDKYIIARETLKIEEQEYSNTVFIFSIENKEKCIDFLKRCNENNCNIDSIKIELHIKQQQTNI